MKNKFLQVIYDFLHRMVADPADSEEDTVKKIIMVGAFLSLVPYPLIFAILFAYFQEALAFWSSIATSLCFSLIPVVFPRFHKDVEWWATAAGVGALIFMLEFTLLLGGFYGSGYLLPFFGLGNPLLALINFKPRRAVIWLLLHIAVLFVITLLQPHLPSSRLPSIVLDISIVLNGSMAAALYFGIFIYFINQRNEAYRLLQLEQVKSEQLLLNILPQEVARNLKIDGRVEPDYFPYASVLFADVVSFTPMSARMTPNESVSLLNEVFSYFDELVEKYGLEKIKTIGDCYMVASGVPRRRDDHAQILARLALDIREYVSQHTFQGQQLIFRIGINSGPVTAGVIGHKKFAYDLWGDTVNTASRMESHGTGGAIQITESTYDLIKGEFVCAMQGHIHVKGKGEMNVWHVMEGRSNLVSSVSTP